jgi:homoserine kinase
MKNEVRVFAPASVANVAVGYDLLGFALDAPGDEITARKTGDFGLRIACITGDGGKLPLEVSRNTAGYAAQQLLIQLGKENEGVELEIHKKMPFGSGLGSSAASAAGAVVAINELFGAPLTRHECLRAAVEGEQIADGAFHADNVAPSLLGGFTLTRSNKTLDVLSLPVPERLCAAVIHPDVKVFTKDARGILAQHVPMATCIEQMGNLGAFIAAMYRNDYDLIRRSLQDVWIEPQRARLIPHFAQAKKAALDNGALGCSISGAGPSIFALCDDMNTAQDCAHALQAVYNHAGVTNQVYVSLINTRGVVNLEKTVAS